MNNIFKNSSLFLAGALAFTFAGCRGDTESNQSIVREAENQVEETELNEDGLTYEEGEYAEVNDQELGEAGYDYNQEYGYEDRELVTNRVRGELDRVEQSIDRINERIETENIDEQMRVDLERGREELEERRDDLSVRLGELKESTEQNWEQVRNEANQSLREFEKEWDELRNKNLEIEVEN